MKQTTPLFSKTKLFFIKIDTSNRYQSNPYQGKYTKSSQIMNF